MPSSREVNLVLFNHRYDAKGQRGDPCTYCGSPSDTMDHIPPLSFAASYAPGDQEFIAVPACRECNTCLGARLTLTITGRRKYVREYLRRKYAKILRMPEWTEEELSEVSPQWAQSFRAASGLARQVRIRIFATLGTRDQKEMDEAKDVAARITAVPREDAR